MPPARLVGGLALAFTAAANKDRGTYSGHGPSGDASRLREDWQVPGDAPLLDRVVALAGRDPGWSHR